jgi:hypothetical protein
MFCPIPPDRRSIGPDDGQREVIGSFPDEYRQTRPGLGMPLGVFRGGKPLEKIIAISGNRPQNVLRACQP